MKLSRLATFSFLVILVACSSNQSSQTTTHDDFQAVSARGDTLYAAALDRETRQKYERRQSSAKSNYQAHPDSMEAMIRYGQATEDLGHIRQAADFYSDRLKNHAKSARLLLQRGRAYIKLRKFDQAATDLQKATSMMDKENQSPKMLPADVQQALGLARYLEGDFEQATQAFKKAVAASPAAEMRVKTTCWLYMTLRRAGHDVKAGNVLEPINSDMNLSEHQTYYKLLLVFKGDFKEKALLNEATSPADSSTIDYGLGNWHYINGRKKHAHKLFEGAVANNNWADDSYIAAETDLARFSLE